MTQPSPEVPQERLIVYVDGFNLYHGMHDKFGRSTLWLDLVELAQSLRPQQRLLQVKYFTAPVVNDPKAQARQARYVQALESKHPHTIEVVWGRYHSRDNRCRKCGHSFVKYEEKETDVSIAVSLVADTALKRMDSAILISADSDLAPAVRAARKLNPSIFIAAAFPPKRYSTELKKLMPSSFHIGDSKFRSLQLPEVFDAGGRSHRRPEKWS